MATPLTWIRELLLYLLLIDTDALLASEFTFYECMPSSKTPTRSDTVAATFIDRV